MYIGGLGGLRKGCGKGLAKISVQCLLREPQNAYQGICTDLIKALLRDMIGRAKGFVKELRNDLEHMLLRDL